MSRVVCVGLCVCVYKGNSGYLRMCRWINDIGVGMYMYEK